MGLALFKRRQRLQGGTEAVPSELPSPPYEPEGWYGKALRSVAEQARQGILPDEALAEIKRDPTSLRSLMAYGEAALAAGTLLSGGEGVKLPKGGEPAGFAPYSSEILKSAKYIDNPEARLARDASGLYQNKEINLPTDSPHNPYAADFVRAHEEAHHIWDGLQNITAADMMQQDPAAFAAFKETSAGKSQLIRHKITGEGVNDPTYFDWIEAVPDLYAEMKMKGMRNPVLEKWLERVIPEENKVVSGYGPRHIMNQ